MVPRTLACTGDSITGRNSILVVNNIQQPSYGWYTWMARYSGQRLQLLKTAGAAGERSDQILARFDADFASTNPGAWMITSGTNDIAQNFPAVGTMAATAIANTMAIVAKCQARPAGAWLPWVFVVGVGPLQGGSTAQKQGIADINRGLRDACRLLPRVAFVQWDDMIRDPVTGVFSTTSNVSSVDGTHPNTLTARRIGWRMAQHVNQVFTEASPLGFDASDLRICTLNPSCGGTAGTLITGLTGVLASNFTANALSGSGHSIVGSKVACTDSLEEWQQLVITNCGTNGLLILQNETTSRGWAASDGFRYFASMEIEIDSGWAGSEMSLSHQLQDSGTIEQAGGTDGIMQTDTAPFPGTGATKTFPTEALPGLSLAPSRFVLRTPAATPGATVTRNCFRFTVNGTGTLRFRRACIQRET